MRRYRTPRRFVSRVKPSGLHRFADVKLPIAGCQCDECEDARTVQEGDRIEQVMGKPDDVDKGAA